MNSDVEKFIKGESKNSYDYFGAHSVNDGVCFRVYAPHAKQIELVIGENNYKLEKIDFRGVYETRVKEIKEFDTYYYEILTNDDTWINKNDPYTFYHDSNKSVYIEKDEYLFNDEKWLNRKREETFFNACVIDENFKLDDQREFIKYLLDYNYNYVIFTPYNKKYLFCIEERFINDSSLKTFIDNLHQSNIGVIFDFQTESFFDYAEGLNDFDGASLYNKDTDKYNGVNEVYFDLERNHTRSYVKSVINYYLENFHGDGLLVNNNSLIEELRQDYSDKIIIDKESIDNKFLVNIIDNVNDGFDYKKFIDLNPSVYLSFDYLSLYNRIKGNEENKKDLNRMLLALTYVSNSLIINHYYDNEEYLKELKVLTELYKSSKLLANKDTKKILLNGKKNNYFAYEFSYKNDYLIMFINFSNLEDSKFDLGMPYYGYYNLVLDTQSQIEDKELYFTRNKKVHNKELALKLNVKPRQILVYKRMKDI